MKTITVTLIAAFSMSAVGLLAEAAPKSKAATQEQSKLSTDIRFDGLDATGRYQAPLGATAGIDKDRETLSLIDFRTNYKDRAKKALSGR